MTSTPRTIRIPPSAPGRRPRRTGRVLLIGTATLAVAVGGHALLDRPDGSATTTVSSVADVREIVIDVDAGPVQLIGGAGPEVGIRTTLHGSATATPVASHQVVAGVLTITASCSGVVGTCHVDEDVTLPAGIPVRVHTDAGAVDGVRLDVPRLDVTTGAGSVSASFVSPPQDVRVETAAGGVDLRVPDVGYRVVTDSALGTQQVGVVREPASPRALTVHTAAGSITVQPS